MADTRRKLTVTIGGGVCDFLDYLMIEKQMNKSAVVEHLLISGITACDDYRKLEEEFELKNYDMFAKRKQDHKEKKIDKTACMPSLKKADRLKK